MNKPVALPILTMIGSSRLAGIFVPSDTAGMSSDEECLRRSLHTLDRLRAGWRPDEALLAAARRMQRWSLARGDNAAYQFVGYAGSPGATSTTIATLLAIDPAGHWALLFPDRWVRLGAPAPSQPRLDPTDIVRRAEAWLLEAT